MAVTTDKHQLILTVNGKEVGNTLKDLDKNAKNLRQEIRGLEVGSERWVAATKEYQSIQKRIKEVRVEVEGVGQNLNKGAGFLSKFGNMAKMAVAAFLPLLAVSKVIELGKALFSLEGHVTKLKGTIQTMTGAQGDQLDDLTIRVEALSKTFNKGNEEIIKSSNVLAKSMGISYAESLDLIEKGLLAGADLNGDFLEQIAEYGPQFKAAGIAAEDFIAEIVKAEGKGIFSDKGADVVKEFGLRIREQTKSTKEALEGAFGQEFTDRIFTGINDGSLKTVDALKMISEEMNNSKIPAAQLQTVVADVFGGPGEDAGIEYLKSLKDIGGELDSMIDTTSGLTARQIEQLEVEKKLAEAKVLLSKEVTGVSNAVRPLANELILKLISGFITFINLIKNIPSFLRENKEVFIAFGVALLSFNAAQIAATASTIYFTAVEKARAIATRSSAVAQHLLNAAMTANPIGLVIKAVGLLVAGFIILYNKSEKVRAGISGLADAAIQIFKNIGQAAVNILGGVGNLLSGVFTLDMELIKKGLKGALKGVTDLHFGLGKGVADAYNKGYDEKLREEEAERQAKKEQEDQEKIKEAELLGQQIAEGEFKGYSEGEKKNSEKLKKSREEAKKKAEQAEKDKAEAALNIQKLRSDLELQIISDDTERKILALQNQAKEEITSLKGTEEQKAMQRKLIMQKTWNEIDQLEDARDQEIEANNKERSRRAAVAQADLDIIQAGGNTEALIEATQAKLDLQMRMELENKDLTEQEKLLIQEQYQIMSAEMEDRFRQERKAKDLEVANSASDLLMGGLQALVDFEKIKSDEKIALAEKEKNAKIKKLDQQLASGKISQAGYDYVRQQAEEEAVKKTNKLKTEQAKKDKQLRVQESIIAGLLAVAKAGNPIMMAVMAVLAGITTAKIIATPIPEFRKGGWLGNMWKGFKKYAFGGPIKGPSHEAGGIKLMNSQTGEIQGEIEGNEFILNSGISRNPSLLAEAFALNERAKKFADGGPINPLSTSANPVTTATQGVAAAAPALDITELIKLRQGFEAFKEEITDWQRNLQVNNNLQETESGLSTLNELRERNKF